MLFKYYTAELMVLGDDKLMTPSITIKTWFFRNPVDAVGMMKNQLSVWGFNGHCIYNLRRIN